MNRFERRALGLCTRCGNVPVSGTLCSVCRKRVNGYNSTPNMLAYHKRWKQEHPDYHREKSRVWMNAHPEYRRTLDHKKRARKRGNGGSWTVKQWLELRDRYGHRCLACGLGEVQLRCLRRKLVPDHVRPLARGGRNDISNLQPLCHGVGGCNNSKGARSCRDYR